MITLAVINLKGGTGKTTTAAMIAHVLYERGQRVLLVDGDPQGSALRWSELADWPIACVALPSPKMHRQLPGIVGDRFDAIVIDTPPLDHDRGIVVSALRAASHVLVPLAPTGVEYDRLAATTAVIEDAAHLRDDRPDVAVLITRTVARAAANNVYRTVIAEDGYRVLTVTVGALQRYAQAYGQPIERAAASAYGDAITELLPDIDRQEVTA